MKAVTVIGLIILVGLGINACGSDDEKSVPTPAPTSTITRNIQKTEVIKQTQTVVPEACKSIQPKVEELSSVMHEYSNLSGQTKTDIHNAGKAVQDKNYKEMSKAQDSINNNESKILPLVDKMISLDGQIQDLAKKCSEAK